MDSEIIKSMKDKDFSLVNYSDDILSMLQVEANVISTKHDKNQQQANDVMKQILHLLDEDKGNGYFVSYVIEMITRILNNKKLDTI